MSAGVDPTYTIIIPASVDFGTLVKGDEFVYQPFDVTASDLVIEDGCAHQCERFQRIHYE